MTVPTTQQLRDTARTKQLDMHTIDRLLCHTLGCSATHLYAHPEQNLNPVQATSFSEYIAQYCSGKPLAQIIGCCEFFSLPFSISPQVLMPRPETELLVSLALSQLKPSANLLELGVGSGAIAVSIAKNYPHIGKITATDIQHSALHLAQKNAEYNGVHSIHFLHSNWFAAIDPDLPFDMIISNPPYVKDKDCHLDPAVATYEPATALFAGVHGLDHLQTIITQAPRYLKPRGLLLLEHSAFQATAVASLMTQSNLSRICCYRDMAGLPRVTVAQKKSLPEKKCQ